MIETTQALIAGLSQIFAWSTFSMMLLGTLIGFWVGILPGLGGPAALALMLPFTITMSAYDTFAFLLSMTATGSVAGDITSILFGVPGESTTVAIILDGHAMAKKGEAGRALGAALMSSLVGAIFAAFFLAVAIPVVRPVILSFTSPEFLALAFLGITFVASLSGGALLKGMIAAGIGLLLSTVGLCEMSGLQRYTFDQLFLWDGIGLIPIAIGLFAVPETIDMAVHGSSIAQEEDGDLGGVMQGVKDTFIHFWLVMRCAAIATFCSLLPGLGGTTSQWLAYAHAVQSSPNKERFGKGAVEGVLGPGSASNSLLGGHLVTTLAFGVPSGIMMAIIMGAFMMHGIALGPDMLLPTAKGGHLTLTYSFVWVIIVSNIITVGICFFFLKQIAKITEVRASLLISPIIVLVFLGAFAEKSAIEDVFLVLLFGGLGWLMVQFNWPRPPLILGLVLGTVAEDRLFISIQAYGGFGWLTRPIFLGILLLTLIGAFYPAFQAAREKRKKRETVNSASSASPRTDSDKKKFLTFGWATIFSLFIVGVLGCALWESRDFDFRTGLFPWAIGFPVLALAIIQLIMDLMGKESGTSIDSMAEGYSGITKDVIHRRTTGAFGWILVLCLAIWLVGFVIAVPLYMFLHLKMGERKEGWLPTFILTAASWALVYGFFGRLMHLRFPEGVLLKWW